MLSLLLSSVLVVTLDTTRHDAFTPQRMPNLHARAKRGLVLDRAYAAAPVTIAAHSAMFTGQTPGTLGIWGNLPGDDSKDIAEEFKEAGYAAHAIVAIPLLFQKAHFGFDAFDHVKGASDAAGQTTRALAWLAEAPDKAFLWVHYFDAHEYKDADEYYVKIAMMDRELERLLAGVKPDTLVLVLADHGEEIGPRGEERGHMGKLTDNVARIPFVVMGPGVEAGTSDEVVRQYDLFATLCDVYSLGCSTDNGVSLKPLFTDAGKKLAMDWAYMESSRYGFAVRDKDRTITVTTQTILFDGQPKTKPSSKEKALLQAGIEKFKRRGPRKDGRVPHKEVIDVLKALGYIT